MHQADVFIRIIEVGNAHIRQNRLLLFSAFCKEGIACSFPAKKNLLIKINQRTAIYIYIVNWMRFLKFWTVAQDD